MAVETGTDEKTGVDWSYDLRNASKDLAVMFLKYGSITNQNKNKNTLTTDSILNFIFNNVYAQYPAGRKLSVHERMLQRNFLADLTLSAENLTTFGTGVGLQLKKMLEKVKAYAEQGEKGAKDDITKAHFDSMKNFITTWQTGDNKALLTK